MILVRVGSAQTIDHYFTVNYAKARPLAMGGAFTAVEGTFESIYYNPATFNLANVRDGIRVSGFINPFASISLYSYYQRDSEDGISNSNWARILKVLPRALVISNPKLEFALLGYEELESRKDSHKNARFFEADSLFKHMVHSALIKVRLANQVFIGGTLSYFTTPHSSKLDDRIGVSYGIYLLPSPKLGIGVVFIDAPNDFENASFEYDRFDDASLNIGINYKPRPNNNFAFDIRNISEENKETTRELHFGFEQGIGSHLYLRSGFYRSPKSKQNNYSFGIGLLNLNFNRNGIKKFNIPVLAINYAIKFAKIDRRKTRTHFLSFNVGF